MIFGLLSLLALSAANEVSHVSYLITFALVVGLVGLVLGFSAARRARLENTMRPRGSIAAIIAKQLTNYEQCLNNAHGTTAQQTCTRQLLHAMESHFHQNG